MAATLSHVWLLVDDIQGAIRFYCDLLGLTLGSDLGEYAELKASDSVYLALFTRAAMQAGEPAIAVSPTEGQRGVLAFEVDELDAFCAGLRAKGVTFASSEADHAAWGLRTAFMYDPAGNLICLYGGIPAPDNTDG
jgi:catechol 2,3-dioxygenase-like lactoylglutathione lyase family enzyme